MATADIILQDEEIARFLETHQGATEEVQCAADQLAERNDALPALKKLLPAFKKKVIYVFFSYKAKDEATANAIVQALRENSAEKLHICYQADCGETIVGKQYRGWIRENVRQANWFILLLPDPSDDYDWCLFETGQFEGLLTSADRMICLHHPDSKLPGPIEGYNAVPATEKEVEKFLKMVFVNEDPIPGMGPINKSIACRIPEIAKTIVDAINPPRQKMYRDIYEPWMEIEVENPKQMTDMADLDQAKIVDANARVLSLFGFLKKPDSLGELRSTLPEQKEDGRWRNELFHVLRRIAAGRQFHPIQAVFKTPAGKMYSPVLHAVDRDGENGPVKTFHITFAEEVSAIDDAAIPRPVAVMATVMRFAFRFKWEVLERFVQATWDDEEFICLENTLRRIKKDWESRGVGGQEAILDLFPKGRVQCIGKMLEHWNKLRNPEGTGRLDVAIEQRDGSLTQELLAGLVQMNQKFLEMTAIQFSEMVARN